MDMILRVVAILIGVFALTMIIAVIGGVLYAGKHDHQVEEWEDLQREKERQEKERPPDPDVLNPAWPEDRRHSGLLEEDEYD